MKLLKNFIKVHKLLFIVTPIALIVSFTNFSLLSIVLILALWALYLPLESPKIGFMTRLVLGFIAFTAINQIIGIFFWKYNLEFTVVWSVFIQIILVVILTSKNASPLAIKTNRTEITALIISSLSVLVIASMTIGRGPLQDKLIRHFTNNFDSSTHISITMSAYETKSYNYGSDDQTKKDIIYKDGSAYPQGWHLNNQILLHSAFNDTVDTKTNLVRLLFGFFSLLLAWYAVVIFLSLIIIASLLDLVNKSTLKSRFLIYTVVAIFLQIFVLLNLLYDGFGNFIAEIAYVAALGLLSVYCFTKLSGLEKQKRLSIFLVIGSMIGAGMALTWQLSVAIPLLTLFFGSLFIYENKYKDLIRSISTNIPVVLPLVVFVLSIIFQYWVFISFASNSDTDVLNMTGGIHAVDTFVLFFVVLSPFIYLSLFKTAKITLYIYSILLSGMIFSFGSVYIFQSLSGASGNYFSIKLSYFPYYLGIVFTCFILINIYNFYLQKASILYHLVIPLIILISVPAMLSLNLTSMNLLFGKTKLSDLTTSQSIQTMARSNYSDDVVVFKELDYGEDVIGTRFFNFIDRKISGCEDKITNFLIIGKRNDLLKTINDCAAEERYTIIASGKNYEDLKLNLNNPNIDVVLSY